MTKNFTNLLDVAQDYCHTIEAVGDENREWLQQVSKLLPKLHVNIAADLEKHEGNGDYMDPNLEIRFELFSKLRQLLGEKDAYWMEYDVAQGDEHRSGSLADDLTDIYCELKHGLMKLEETEDPACILGRWHSGYQMHWGRHLVDAERHLYDLAAKNELLV